MRHQEKRVRVVIIGAGFAGINAARELASASVQVTLIDKKNHHLFQPLLYQVALAGLSPAQIAVPIRGILRSTRNVEVLLEEVTDIQLSNRVVVIGERQISYDFLIVAAGARHSYFGNPQWEQNAPGLKTLEDALEIRRRILLAFEIAELEALTTGNRAPLNFVVIGAGPTGVELAGAISDMAKRSIVHDFRGIKTDQARVILLEGGPRVLPNYPEDLSASAEKQLREMGVEVHVNSLVSGIESDAVVVGNEKIHSAVVLWCAGVAASPLAKMLGAQVDRAGRVLVNPDLSVPGHEDVFVVGDLAAAKIEGGMVPAVAPAAIQMGQFVARQIKHSLEGKPREKFNYKNRGNMATIGVSRAVAEMGSLRFSGHFAWMAWAFIHLVALIGFHNRFMVLMEWIWSYFSFNRSARLITVRPDSSVGLENPAKATDFVDPRRRTESEKEREAELANS